MTRDTDTDAGDTDAGDTDTHAGDGLLRATASVIACPLLTCHSSRLLRCLRRRHVTSIYLGYIHA